MKRVCEREGESVGANYEREVDLANEKSCLITLVKSHPSDVNTKAFTR